VAAGRSPRSARERTSDASGTCSGAIRATPTRPSRCSSRRSSSRTAPRAVALARIRLATALQYAGRHDEALREFDRAERVVRGSRLRGLGDLVEQHRGKRLAELERRIR